MARMREIGASFDKGYRDDLNYNFGLLEALIGEASGLTDALRQEMLNYINNLQQQIDMLTGENIGELLERLNDSIQQALTAAQEARTAKTATEEATALATTATELANASALLADEKANYANEKAVLAQNAADNANQEASNLSQLKIDVVQATQDANTATGNANQATQAAQTATDAIYVVLPNVTGLVNLKEWTIETQYKKNNFVTLEGNGYMALRDNKGVRPPSLPVLSNADWAMFVQKGEKGEQGTGVRILGTLLDESALPSIGEPGDAYLINGDLYVWSDTTIDWTNVGTIKGPKGDTGPQGPQGEQGPPGQDADLTEVNQEIANLQQTVTDNKTEVTEHLGHDVLSENGAHGIRYFNNELAVEDEQGQWVTVETGGAELYQNNVMREETSNAIGSNTFSKSTLFASIVNSVDAANNKLTLWNTEGISVSDAVKLKRNDSVILEDATIIAISGQVITISTLVTLDTTITHVFKLGGSKTNQNAEGLKTVSSGSNSHAEGMSTVAFGDNSHAEGMETYTSGTASHAEGRFTKATGFAAHAEGLNTKATGNRAHAEGAYTEAIGDDSHAEGQGSKAAGAYSHAEGSYTEATGAYSHAEGQTSVTIGEASHAEGYKTRAEGHYSHTEGSNTKATANSAHAEGAYTEATGNYSHAEGNRTKAKGEYSHSSGDTTTADVFASTAIGRYNKVMSGSPTIAVATDDAFVIGNGTSPTSLSNALRVRFNGSTYGMGAWNSTGADYAEFFEWSDGNVDNEDRVGFVVALDGDKIRKATAEDTYLLGIISANPSVIGDSHQDDWNNKYVADEWGRIQYHWIEVEYEELMTVPTEDGVHNETVIKTRQDYVPILNPDWNNDEEYIPREQRKEWDTVGLIGKLLVRDDGTCEVNSYAKVGAEEGTLTASNYRTDMRVIERVAPNIVRVFIK
ncbi:MULTISPECIES: peptidase G2 autoproteolytic cleavage domain-containing protein [Lysinibacillus]|uniref:Peptidase G2 autoproteolytic cleavage domain-containing protein n=1 Tax=Lysinibacillus capsici TaxID=2115968 RepID=A0ABY8KR21_9BACI|nr:peptidase G2 autoproteolytic cleavage domain-containing protein [Lysinibacillus capsici]WGF40246.1 peptidase G2 autoproteolytic cleavage domain-containing protein [Lysinibacillus capsici]